MDHTACSETCQFLASYTLHSFRAPVCTNVREHLSATSQQLTEQHCHSVASIVFSSNYICFADTVPVECTTHQRFSKVTVWLPVSPLALALETGCDSVVADCFFQESLFAEFRVALHQVANDESHLHYEFPVSILTCAVFLLFRTVLVPTFVHLAPLFSPSHCLFVFFVVVDTFFHTAEDFCFVHAFVTHTEVFLEEILVNDTTSDTHTLATDRQVAFATHSCYSESSTCPTENLFSYVSRD